MNDEGHHHLSQGEEEEESQPQRLFGSQETDGGGRVNIATLLNIIRAAQASPSSHPGVTMNNPRSLAAVALAQLLARDDIALDEEEEEVDVEFVDEDEEGEDAGFMDDEYQDVDDHDWYPGQRSVYTFAPASSPEESGVNLIKSGEFGRVSPKIKARKDSRNLATVLNNRLTRPHPALFKEDYASNLVPNSNGCIVANYDANIYTAQFSRDSSFFYTCAQDFRLHIYDTTAPPLKLGATVGQNYDPHLQTTMNVSRRIQGEHGRWTITDANLSPDNDRIIYSSITSTAYMCSTKDANPAQIPIPFHDVGNRYGSGEGSFGLYSCRFSADGNEVIAGGRGHIYVYDLLANKRSVKILAHGDDVNSCCWADTASGNVLVSASDDSFLKVWDRRSLGSSPKPSGVLMGHTEGITYVSAKGDGRYVISNGKDQALRLWDLRKMRTSAEYDRVANVDYGVPHFDYRYPSYPKPRYRAHPMDCSVMTYRGHTVLTTLIRCHFSPGETTGGQYLYSGSTDGRIHIWSLDGTIVQVLDRQKTLPIWSDSSGVEHQVSDSRHGGGACVRDVSWHSQQPVLISAAWESMRHGSSLARHEWKGLSKMSNSLEDWTEKRRQEQGEVRRSSRQQGLRRAMMPGSYLDDDDEEEDEDYHT